MVPLLVPLSMLLIAAAVLLVLGYRRQSRLSRNEANLRISRDRANLDLQMLSHQVQRVHTQTDGSASLSDSLPAKQSTSLSKVPAASLPPGPPSSSTGQSVAEQEVTRSGAADVGVAPAAPEELVAQPESASARRAKKRTFTSPYHEFCQEQRPLLMPLGMRNRDREKLLGVLAP